MITIITEIKVWFLILSSFFIALILMFLHLPDWVQWVNPEWLIMVLLYLAFVMPYRINVGSAWLLGCLLDIIYNTPLGANAFALVLVTYIITRFSEKIKILYFWKKAAVIFSLIALCQLLPLLLQLCLGKHFIFWPIFSRSITSALVWIVIESLFNHKRRLYFESYR